VADQDGTGHLISGAGTAAVAAAGEQLLTGPVAASRTWRSRQEIARWPR
jgi:hypothetical protein